MTNYELLERIGVGGMAEVWRGRATAEGGFEKPVAIKRILPHLSQDDRFVRMLIGEAKLLANLRQRNIVQVYDVGVGDDGAYFLVLEYVDGKDLTAIIERLATVGEPFPRALALHVGAEIADALDYAHTSENDQGQRLGLVHRDVSPSNVLVSRAGEIKLTDFGIAKQTTQQQSVVASVVGKLAYMSPEQARAEPVGPASDVYSLGVVLWELLLGQPMYGHTVDLRIVDAVRKAQVPRPRDVDPSFPRALEEMLLRALALHPRDRFRSAAAFGAALRDYHYSTSQLDDPPHELAQLVKRLFDVEPKRVRHDEPSQVLRIVTKIGVDLDGYSTATHPAGGKAKGGMDFFEEPTRAAPELARRLADGEVRIAESSPILPPPRLPGMVAAAPAGRPRLPNIADEVDMLTSPEAPVARRQFEQVAFTSPEVNPPGGLLANVDTRHTGGTTAPSRARRVLTELPARERVAAQRTASPTPTMRPTQRNRWLWLVLAIVVVAVATTAIGMYLKR